MVEHLIKTTKKDSFMKVSDFFFFEIIQVCVRWPIFHENKIFSLQKKSLKKVFIRFIQGKSVYKI